jgi:hypothetical protein
MPWTWCSRRACGQRALSSWLFAAGGLSLLGIVGPVLNVIGLRDIGIFGYAVLFPVACLGISRSFERAVVATPDVTALGMDISVS